MLYLWPVVGCLFCAVQAIRAPRLLTSALWLAGVSVSLATLLYAIGAHEIAVIELSVGTGLVTILFVFAVAITGAGAAEARALIPKPLAWGLVVAALLLLSWMTIPWAIGPLASPGTSFSDLLWRQRGLDVLVQIVLIFAGAIGVLGLLADERTLAVADEPATPTPAAFDRAMFVDPAGAADLEVAPEEVAV